MSIRLKIISLLQVFCLMSVYAQAQNQKEIDSLESVLLKFKKADTNKVEVYNQLAFLYRRSDKDRALKYLDTAAAISTQLNYQSGLVGAYNRYGIVYKYKAQYEKSINYYEKSIAIARQLKDTGAIADVYNNIGNVYKLQGMPVQASEAFIHAMKLREAIADTPGLAAAYSNLSYLYADQKNFRLSIENNQKSIDLYAIVKDSFELARGYTQMGFIHYYQNHFDSAIYYANIGLKIFEQMGDKVETAILLNNMGNILSESGQPQKAGPYLEKALRLNIELGDSTGIYTSHISLAQTYIFLHDYTKAEQHLTTALAILEQIHGAINYYIETYLVASQLYKNKKDYKRAYEYIVKYKNLSDTLINENNVRTIAELQEKYDSDKKDLLIENKELEIRSTNARLRQRNIIAIILAALIAVIVLAAYLLYNRYKLKKQQELNEVIIKQQELRSKAVIDAEEQERTRIAKDLHDGIGQQLSAVKLLANSLEHTNTETEHNTKLTNLKTILDDSIKEVRAISHNMMPNALFKLGLNSAIREFIDKISSTGLLKIDLQIIELNKQLDKTTEVILYRVIQELVNNIIKHAQAHSIGIQIINHDDTMLNILVEDDGVGFDTGNKNSFSGIGLKNIISRIEYINGTVEFDSSPGRGTTVIIDVPIG